MSVDVLATRDPSVLADGTPLAALFDMERRQISARVLSDPEIFQLELSRVFARSWLFLGLASEIANPGDYVVRPLGGASVIVTRDQQGAVNVLLNRCSHRGTQLCVSDAGHTRRFRCPYHGWLYGSDGRLEAMPAQQEWLGPTGDKADYALYKARVAIRGGLIFGTWDHDMPDFETYLGDFSFYFDLLFRSVDKDLVALGPPQRWRVPFNWKIAAENGLGDGLHVQAAHESVIDIGMGPPAARAVPVGTVGSEPRWGHGFWVPSLHAEPPPLESTVRWLPKDVLPQLEQHLCPEQLTLLHYGSTPIMTIFPSTQFVAQPYFFFARTWQPVGPTEMEMWTWALGHPDLTEEEKRGRDQALNLTMGPTGIVEQDDLAIWTRIQRASGTVIGRKQTMTYACTRAADKRGYLPDGGEWPGPGRIWQGFPPDDHLWNYHMRLLHLMNGGEA